MSAELSLSITLLSVIRSTAMATSPTVDPSVFNGFDGSASLALVASRINLI